MQVWEERADSALRGIEVICQVAEAARRSRVGGAGSALLTGPGNRATSCPAPEPFKVEEM